LLTLPACPSDWLRTSRPWRRPSPPSHCQHEWRLTVPVTGAGTAQSRWRDYRHAVALSASRHTHFSDATASVQLSSITMKVQRTLGLEKKLRLRSCQKASQTGEAARVRFRFWAQSTGLRPSACTGQPTAEHGQPEGDCKRKRRAKRQPKQLTNESKNQRRCRY